MGLVIEVCHQMVSILLYTEKYMYMHILYIYSYVVIVS